jgi:hypothetical protein
MNHWERLATNLIDRLHGPLTFRLILQPTMACLMAIRDGLKDAKANQPAYFFSILTDPAHRKEQLREGWHAVLKIFFLAILIDGVYQWKVLHWFYPGEALIIAILLAQIPYLLVRGPVNRIAKACQKSTKGV